MTTIIKVIGCIVLSLILYAIPVLLVCSIAYKWDDFVTIVLFILAFGEFCALWNAIYNATEVE